MTHLEFIQDDLETYDFTSDEKVLLIKTLDDPEHSEFLNSEYQDYDAVDSFYRKVLN